MYLNTKLILCGNLFYIQNYFHYTQMEIKHWNKQRLFVYGISNNILVKITNSGIWPAINAIEIFIIGLSHGIFYVLHYYWKLAVAIWGQRDGWSKIWWHHIFRSTCRVSSSCRFVISVLLLHRVCRHKTTTFRIVYVCDICLHLLCRGSDYPVEYTPDPKHRKCNTLSFELCLCLCRTRFRLSILQLSYVVEFVEMKALCLC